MRLNPQIQKEIRCIAPTAVTCAVVSSGVQLLLGRRHAMANDSIPIFALFAAFVAATSFGVEWTNGTFPMLLSQPVSRRRLWLMKSAVLLAVLTAVFVVYSTTLSLPAREYPLMFLTVLCAAGIAPWLTLLLRDGVLATCGTLLVEWVIMALAFQAFRWRVLRPDEIHLTGARYEFAMIAGIACALGGWYAGRRSLCQWEATPPRTWTSFLGVERAATSSSTVSVRRGPLHNLLTKELRLHRLNAMIAAVFCLPFVLFMFYAGPEDDFLSGWFKFYSFLFPVAAGAVAIAPERQMGTHETQLALPMSAARQWTIKLAICFGVSLAGSIVIPWALLCIRSTLHGSAGHNWFKLFDYTSEVVIFTAIAILASAASRGTLRAAILGSAAAFASLIYYGWIVNVCAESALGLTILRYLRHGNPIIVNKYTFILIAAVAVAEMLRPAFRLFRRPSDPIHHARLTIHAVSLLTVARVALLYLPVLP